METMYRVLYTNTVDSDPALLNGSFLTDAPQADNITMLTFGTKVFEVNFIDHAKKEIHATRIR